MLESFFIYGTPPSNAEEGVYQIPLVVLSYMVASFASYTALSLAQQLAGTNRHIDKRILHWGGAFAMGAGIWSMHFIGMLSYKMDMVVKYDPALTFFSGLIAIAFSYAVLSIVSRPQLPIRQILIGGVLLGIGICSMHYTGMAAMKMDGDLRYTPGFFLLSFAIAIAASAAALWMAFTLARSTSRYRYLYQIAAALVMGAAICGMHYTGMLAAVFIPWADCRYDPHQSFQALAISIAAITTVILFIALAVGAYRKTQAEFLLQASEAKLRAIVDNVLDGLVTLNDRGVIESFNPACERIFGYKADEVLGKNIKMLLPEAYQDETLTPESLRVMGLPSQEIKGKRKDGSPFSMELSLSAFTLDDGRHFSGIIRDITDRKKAEAMLLRYTRELEHINSNLDDFVYIASHDLKEPVRGMHNYASFLLEDYADKLDEAGKEQLQILQNLSVRLGHLIDNLLQYSRIGREDLALEQTDMNALVADTLELMEPQIREQNVTVTIDKNLPVMACHPVHASEVFRNLVTNAIKYNDSKQKKVQIGCTASHLDYLGKNVFFVKDNGIGIAEEHRKTVFKMFKRLHGQNEYGGGTGSGLAIIEKIIDRHGGKIWVEANPDGKGSVFYFTLSA